MSIRVKLTEEVLLKGWMESMDRKPPPVVSAQLNKTYGLRINRDELIKKLTLDGVRPAAIARRLDLETTIVASVVRRLRNRNPELFPPTGRPRAPRKPSLPL